MNEVLERCIARIDTPSPNYRADEFYFYWLTTFHEGMHAEALAYTRQTLGYPPPRHPRRRWRPPSIGGACPGDVEIPGGKFT